MPGFGQPSNLSPEAIQAALAQSQSPAATSAGAPAAVAQGTVPPNTSGWGFLKEKDYSAAQAAMGSPDYASSLVQARRNERLTPTATAPILGGGAVGGGELAPPPGLPGEQARTMLPPRSEPAQRRKVEERVDHERERATARGAGGGGGGDLQGQLKGAFGDSYRPPGKDYGPAKEALGMTAEWKKAHEQELAAADEGERRAQENAAEQYRIGQEKQAHLAGMQDAQDVLAKEEQAKQAAHAQEVERKKGEVQKLHDDAANDRIDAGRIWNKNPAGGVLAILGAVAGGIQTAYTHGPNTALEMINKTVDRDIEAQRANHAIKGEKAAAGDRMLDRLREQGLDEAGQRAAMRNMALSKGQLGLQAITAQSDNQNFKSNADKLHAAIEAEKAKNQATIDQQIGQTQYAIDHPKPTGGGGEADRAEVAYKLKTMGADQAAERLNSQDELAGYGVGGRALNAARKVPVIGGLAEAATSKEANQNRLDARTIAAEYMKQHNMPTRGSAIDDFLDDYGNTPDKLRNLTANVREGSRRGASLSRLTTKAGTREAEKAESDAEEK